MLRIVVESPDRTSRRLEPVTCGVPWPRGVLNEPSRLVLWDEQGRQVPLQARSLNFWSDGSVRWALLDWKAVIDANGSALYRAEIAGAAVPGDAAGIRVTEKTDRLLIDTGPAQFQLGVNGPFPFDAVRTSGKTAIDPARTRFVVEDQEGRRYEPTIERVEVEQAGPLRTMVRLDGDLTRDRTGPLARFFAHVHFFDGSATVRFDLTILNPRPAIHPKNLWDLGDGGSIYIRDAALTVGLPPSAGPTVIRGSVEPGLPWRDFHQTVEVYQDSSGGEHWRSPVHLNRNHVVPNTFRGYRMRCDGAEEIGERATPIVAIERGDRTLAIATEHFWQDFPKAMEADAGTIVLRLFPHQYADVHELQGGEQKTHAFVVAFGRDTVTDEPLAWCRKPLRPRAEPAWYASSGAVAYLTPSSEDPNAAYLRLVNAAIEGTDTFESKREMIDEYGWRHFGELYADHEAAFHRGPGPRVSHYNNQYDVVGGCALQFLRSGDWRWWALMREMARHVADIDVYHTDGDKSAYNHGLFWHTYHYVDADTSTNRAYPSAAGIPGGGPSGGHNYTTGLMLHHFLTGDPLSRDTALELARWTIDMDDGRKTIFRWLAAGPTGHATASGSPDYHGPGRAPANCVTTLMNAHQLTGEDVYLHKAEQIIRRCIHPADNIDARNLLDAESKWFYTMFLQALGNYLDHKAELGQFDPMYAYAREALLRYARWMAEHEYPYLEKPEKLEYPTETWAAQDMRKSEIFKIAAKHTAGDERSRFLEQSEHYFRYSTTTLEGMATRSMARPVALLLSNGLTHAYFQQHPDVTAPFAIDPPDSFGSPEVFVPQKTWALQRFKTLAVAGLLSATLIAVAVAAWMLRESNS